VLESEEDRLLKKFENMKLRGRIVCEGAEGASYMICLMCMLHVECFSCFAFCLRVSCYTAAL
jgi:hypothetical protein